MVASPPVRIRMATRRRATGLRPGLDRQPVTQWRNAPTAPPADSLRYPSSPSSLPVSTFDPVTDYATRVTSGLITANKWVRLACLRHLSDLSRPDLYWDLPAALHRINYSSHVLNLRFKEEPFIRPFILLPHQCFIEGSIFGWKQRTQDPDCPGAYLPVILLEDGRSTLYRRFRRIYVEAGKGCGKSPEAAGTMLYLITSDGEPQAEGYFAAGNEDQARVAFDAAVAMVDISPELTKRMIKSGQKKVMQITFANPQTEREARLRGSFIKPIDSGTTQSGPRPHAVLFDEVHEIKREDVVEMMDAALGKNRSQAVRLAYTNSGTDRKSICYQFRSQAEQMLDEVAPNDTLFAFICGLDVASDDGSVKGDIPKDADPMEYLLEHEEIWEKANPGIAHGVPSYDYVREQIMDAITMPSRVNKVLRLHFCLWTDAVSIWIPSETWMGCADPSLAGLVQHEKYGRITQLENDLIGRRCYGGIDLARSNDWSAMLLIFPDDRGEFAYPEHEESQESLREKEELRRLGEQYAKTIEDYKMYSAGSGDAAPPDLGVPDNQTYSILEYFWIDEETYQERKKKNKLIEVWRRDGHLIVTPGPVFNPGAIQRFILETLAPRYQIDGIAYDPTFAHQIVTNLGENGLVMVEWRQTFWWMGAPVSEIARRARARLWRHRGHPVMRWQMSNVQIEESHGLQRISKEKAKDKVDGPSALADAMGWCMRANKGPSKGSVYEERGPIIIEDVFF